MLLAPFVCAAALYSAGAFFPGLSCWGFDFYAWLPPSLLTVSLAITATVFALSNVQRVATLFETSLRRVAAARSKVAKLLAGLAISATLLTLFMLFRSRSPLYGDGYTVLSDSYEPFLTPLNGIHDFLKPLTVLLFRAGHAVFSGGLGLDPQAAFSLVSSLCGVVGFWGIVRLSRLAGHDLSSQGILLLGTLTSACTVLFFGYIEHYPVVTASMLWLMARVVSFLRTGKGIAWVVGTSVVTIVCDAMLTPLVMLVIIFVVGRKLVDHSTERLFPLQLKAWHLNAAILVSSLATAAVIRQLNLPFLIVPLSPEPNNPYAVLSIEHIRDFVNLALHVAPIGLFSLVAWLSLGRSQPSPVDPVGSFLLSCAILLGLISFWLDPLLGAARDWDLLSFLGFPLSFAGLYFLLRDLPRSVRTDRALLPVLAVFLFVLVPNVAEKSTSAASVDRLGTLMWQDVHYSPEYDHAYRNESWGYLLYARAERPDLATRCYRRLIATVPDNDSYRYNLGKVYMTTKQFDSAALFFREALNLRPNNGAYVAALSHAEQEAGDTAEAARLAEQVEMMRSETAQGESAIGVTLAQGRRYAEALGHFRKAYEFAPTFEQCANIAIVFDNLGERDSSLVYFQEAEKLAPEDKQASFCRAVLVAQLNLGRVGDAQATLDRYRRFTPQPADIADLERQLGRATGR